MKIIQDDNGNNSSLRIVMLFSLILLIYQLYEFRVAYRLEIAKQTVDYNGLAVLFAALVSNFVFVVILKVIQKKFEK